MISLVFIFLGIAIGIVLGLIPGMNINNALPLFLSLSAFIDPVNLSVLIVSAAVAEVVSDCIPSVFLGAPESDASLSVLPAHKMLLKGKGMEALKIMLVSSLVSFLFSLLIILLFSNYFASLYKYTRPYVHYAILWTVVFLIVYSNDWQTALKTAGVFLLSGFWGLLVLNLKFLPSDKAMFPLLSGLFGFSTLLISLNEKSHLPKQAKTSKIEIPWKKFLASVVSGSFFGILAGFLPAIGVSQAAILAQAFTGLSETRAFLASVSSVMMANEIFSLSSLYLVNNPRSGASVALQKLLPVFTGKEFFSVVGAFAISLGFSTLIVWFLSSVVYKKLVKIDYKKLNLIVIGLLATMVFVFSGFAGLAVFLVSGALGFFTASIGVRRSTCMGVLLLPSFLFFAGLDAWVLNVLKI